MFSKTDRVNASPSAASLITSTSLKNIPTQQSYIRSNPKQQKPCDYGNFDTILQENTPMRMSDYQISRKRPSFVRQLPVIKEERQSIYQSDSKSLKQMSNGSQISSGSRVRMLDERKVMLPKSGFYLEVNKENICQTARSDTQLNSMPSIESSYSSNSEKKLVSSNLKGQFLKNSSKKNNAPMKFLDIKPDNMYFPRPFYSQRDIQHSKDNSSNIYSKNKPQTADGSRVRSQSDFTHDFKKKDQLSSDSTASFRSIGQSDGIIDGQQEEKKSAKIQQTYKIQSSRQYMLDRNIYANGNTQARQQQLALWEQQVQTPSCCMCLAFGRPAAPQTSSSLGISYRNPTEMFGPHPW